MRLEVYTEKLDMQPSSWGAAWSTDALLAKAAEVLEAQVVDDIRGRFEVTNVRSNTPASTLVFRVSPKDSDFRQPGRGVCAVLGDGLRCALKADVFVVETAKKAPAGVYDVSLIGAKKLYPDRDNGFFFMLQTEVDQLRAKGPKAAGPEVAYFTLDSETLSIEWLCVPSAEMPGGPSITHAVSVRIDAEETVKKAQPPVVERFLFERSKNLRKELASDKDSR